MLATFLMYAVGIALACGLGVVGYRAWQNRDSDPVRNEILDQLPQKDPPKLDMEKVDEHSARQAAMWYPMGIGKGL